MKWSFVVQQKVKVSLLLGGIMVLIILGTLLSRSNVKGIDKSFSSIYRDRLIPATTIIYLTENLYGKRLSMEQFLLSTSIFSFKDIENQLDIHNQNIDSLISAFEKTYLVDQEAKSLSAFKNRVAEYILLEKMILKLHSSGQSDAGRRLFEGTGAETFRSSVVNLNELTSIQSDVGEALMRESKSEVASFTIISFLQTALAIVIGLMVLVLIQSSKIINQPRVKGNKEQNFHLN